MGDLMEPMTPREFALVTRIRDLERLLAVAQCGGILEILPSVPLAHKVPPGHVEMWKAATVIATKVDGRMVVTAKHYTQDKLCHYEFTQYLADEFFASVPSSSLLSGLYREFLWALARDIKEPIRSPCEYERSPSGPCGPSGKHFAARDDAATGSGEG